MFVLAVAVVAVLAGAVGYRQIADQAADLPQSLLARLGGKWNRFRRRYDWPSEPTLRRVLQCIDADALDLLIGVWLFERACRDVDGLLVIALDGKVLRGAWTGENDQVTLFSAMIHDVGVPVAQIRVPDGTNEITQVPALLDNVKPGAGQRVAVTLDAAHTQHETAEYLKGSRGFDYFLVVKGNQPGLQKSMVAKCGPLVVTEAEHVVEERRHGRISRWSTWVTDAMGIDFPYAEQVACIRRDVFDLDGTPISKEHALILTSTPADQAGPAEFHARIRGHWGIENKIHYVRDTAWREDDNRTYVGNGPQSMAAIKNLAMGLFRLNKIHAIKAATEAVCRDRSRALVLMAT